MIRDRDPRHDDIVYEEQSARVFQELDATLPSTATDSENTICRIERDEENAIHAHVTLPPGEGIRLAGLVDVIDADEWVEEFLLAFSPREAMITYIHTDNENDRCEERTVRFTPQGMWFFPDLLKRYTTNSSGHA